MKEKNNMKKIALVNHGCAKNLVDSELMLGILSQRGYEITLDETIRFKTKIDELDRVLGGGFVQGSLVLLAGDPGIGKSTLILQLCDKIKGEGKVLYVSGEESAEQIKLRADRLMAGGKLVDAMYEYETLLSDEVAKTMSRITEGDVYHNLGCAFAKLFFFEEACRCFDEGYKRNQKKQTLYQLLYSARCAKNKQMFDEYVSKYQVSRADVEEVLQIVTRATVKEDIVGFDSSVNDLLYGNSSEEAKATIENVIANWKKEYIKICRI